MTVGPVAVAWKVAAFIDAAFVGMFFLQPTVQVALIGLAGTFITTSGAFLVVYIQLKRIGAKVDGIQTRLEEKNVQKGIALTAAETQLHETSAALAHAEGVQQERVEERTRQNDAK